MSTKISVGDTVEVLEVGSADSHMLGVKGRVIDVYPTPEYRSPTNVMVEDPTGNGMWLREGGVRGWWFLVTDVKKDEEYLADWEKELLGIETKQEETPVKQTFKAGDKVRDINGSRWHKQGESGKITAVDRWDNLELNGWWLFPQNVELVTGKPKARSQEIKLEDVQVGDTVVAFWNLNGVEYRQKGTVAKINSDGEPITDEGNFVVHTGGDSRAYSFGTPAEHIFLLERPEVKEPELADGTYWIKAWGDIIRVEVKDEEATFYRPDGSTTNDNYTYLLQIKRGESSLELLTEDPTPKGFDALDKSVKYFLKGRDGATDFVLEVVGGDWKYGWVGDNTRVNAKQYEKGFTEGNGAWEKPVPYEPTVLEKHTEAGTIGNRYRSGRVEYKVTKKGKIKGIITNDPLDTWANVHWSYETFKDYVDRGTIYKI